MVILFIGEIDGESYEGACARVTSAFTEIFLLDIFPCLAHCCARASYFQKNPRRKNQIQG